MSGKEIVRILEKNGWKALRTKGSHVRMGKGVLRTTVPLHGSSDIGSGLLKAIEKQTGVKLK
jgi:predicted RNA binding protein YcfA (HicA-like mRNA interferase family)